MNSQDPTESGLIAIQPPLPPTTFSLDSEAEEFRRHSKSDSTLRAYRDDWSRFEKWCATRGEQALPASDHLVARYAAAHARSHKSATIERWMSSVSQAHKTAAFDSPTSSAAVQQTLAGIRRTVGTAQAVKRPLSTADIRRMVRSLPGNSKGIRDRAMLLLGFAGAFRRSELVGLDAGDIEETDDGLVVTLRRSKTDQDASGRRVGIPFGGDPTTCPVRAYRAWRAALGDDAPGPLFRAIDRHGRIGGSRLTAQSVALVVKHQAAAAGLDAGAFAGHSLRSGHATTAAAHGATERSIMKTTGHKSERMVRRYIQDGGLFLDNSATLLGL